MLIIFEYLLRCKMEPRTARAKETIDALDALGALGNLPKSNQLSLFRLDFFLILWYHVIMLAS